MDEQPEKPHTSIEKTSSKRIRNLVIFGVVVCTWLLLDFITKRLFTEAFAKGTVPDDSILGLFQFTLVHNTGAAWGIFGDSTAVLAIVSVVVSILVFFYFLITSSRANLAEVLGLALIIAGGIGNAVDRFVWGHVVDFIEFSFIKFPVFNIADMGVTCGFIILLSGILYTWFKDDHSSDALLKEQSERDAL